MSFTLQFGDLLLEITERLLHLSCSAIASSFLAHFLLFLSDLFL